MYERFKGAAGHLLVILFIWGLFGGPTGIEGGEYRMPFVLFMGAVFCWGWIWEHATSSDQAGP